MGIDPSTNFVVHLLMKVPKRDDFAQKWPRKYFFLTMDMDTNKEIEKNNPEKLFTIIH